MPAKQVQSGGVTTRVIVRPREELDAEHEDPYAQGWDAGEHLDEPPPCPYKSGTSARLWRSGFSARVDDYIAKVRKSSGLNADLASSGR
jgi:hypothetical protein